MANCSDAYGDMVIKIKGEYGFSWLRLARDFDKKIGKEEE